MKIYLVSARNGEVVGFTDKKDAKYASDGFRIGFGMGVSSLGQSFREFYAEDGWEDDDGDEVIENDPFPILEIELTPEQVKALEINAYKETI